MRALREHWPEYLMEAAELGIFLVAACAVVVLLEHPDLPFAAALPDANMRRALIGAAMGLTAIAIIYSPWGEQSGAHFNPAVTLTYFALGKIGGADAVGYVLAQFTGAVAGMLVASLLFGDLLAHATVDWVATRPGGAGNAGAFAAEVAISFLMMTMVLALTRRPRLAPYTGVCAGLAVALFITFEAPVSGMSMNPARSFGPAVVGRTWTDLWIYFAAPPLGMLAAAALSLRIAAKERHCPKLNHGARRRCIFCGAPGTAPARTLLRRARAPLLLALLTAGTAAAPSGAAADDAGVHAVRAVSITVADAERSRAFFSDLLGFAVVGDAEVWGSEHEHLQGVFGLRMRVVRLRLGDEEIELVEYLTPAGEPLPADSRSHDRWFQHVAIIVSDIDQAFARLRAQRVRLISPAPQTLPEWNSAAAGIRALYFKDPDGHALEILQFPPGKGAAKWQRRDALFLGIDHTAIVVADTDESLRFYRDALGLQIAGESENYGPEQERLNNVFGARLRITGLRAAHGPGVELLEYLTPSDGRPIPADQAANDIAHWETSVQAPSADAAAELLRRRRAAFVSPGVVELPDDTLGFRRAFLVRDPDGHVVRVAE